MKKIVFFTALTLMLVVLFTGCPQKVKPSQDSGDGARIFKDVKKVQLPINVIKDFDGTSGKALMTDAMRTGLDYVKTVIASTGTAPSTTSTTADIIKPTYVEWQIGVSFDKDVDPFNESLILKHVTVQNFLATAGSHNDLVSLKYTEIKQRRGRDIEVGDQFWVGFRAISSEGKEIARIKQHIEVANPSEVQSITLHYGFDSYYLKATLNGKYPTTTAVFYLGADAKAAEVVATAVNGQVHNDIKATLTTPAIPATTTFICKVPAEKLVKNQPYHARVTFKDVEVDAKGLERETAFDGVDIVYSDTASSAWNFQIPNVDLNTNFALASEEDSGRKAVLLDTADPTLKWNKMDDAAALYNNISHAAVLKNPKYVIRLAETADGLAEADPERYKVVTGTTMSADLSGLQFNKVYYAQVEFSYDIKEANSMARKSHKSPVVSFKTVDGLVSPLYTFDSGREIPYELPSPSPAPVLKNPADLKTNGAKENTGGDPSNCLKLAANKYIESHKGSKYYNNAELTMDVVLDKDAFDVMVDDSSDASFVQLYDKKTKKNDTVSIEAASTTHASFNNKVILWSFETGDVKLILAYVKPYFETTEDDYTVAGGCKWSLKQGEVILIATDGIKKDASPAIFTSSTTVKNATGDIVTDYGTNNTTSAAITGYQKITTVSNTNRSWIEPYTLKIKFNNTNVVATLTSKKDSAFEKKVTLGLENYKPKTLGYNMFKFTNDGATDVLVDNVVYKVTDEKFSRKVR